jgi:hypothetical protein
LNVSVYENDYLSLGLLERYLWGIYPPSSGPFCRVLDPAVVEPAITAGKVLIDTAAWGRSSDKQRTAIGRRGDGSIMTALIHLTTTVASVAPCTTSMETVPVSPPFVPTLSIPESSEDEGPGFEHCIDSLPNLLGTNYAATSPHLSGSVALPYFGTAIYKESFAIRWLCACLRQTEPAYHRLHTSTPSSEMLRCAFLLGRILD